MSFGGFLKSIAIGAALIAAPILLPGLAGVAIGATTLGAISTSFGASLVLGGIARFLTPKPKGLGAVAREEIKRELSAPTSRPAKRFVYGRYRLPGSPAPLIVRGENLYMCIIMNSRPSAGSPTIYMDNRQCYVFEGDLFDFVGAGAALETVDPGVTFAADPAGRPRAWMGLGGQTTPPDAIVSEIGDTNVLKSTDGWRGLTVLWLKIPVGPNQTRTDRWPRTPPEVEVEANWSLVWDPRDPAQNPDDPATWAYSNNQALCLLDAILRNPIRRRPRELVDIPAFIAAANIADQPVARFYAGGTVPRYTANGVLIWSSGELVDQISPLAAAGGGDMTQVGGVISYVPPVAQAPDYAIADILDDGGFEFTRLAPGSTLPTAVKATYVAPDRGWQDSDLPALAVGAGAVGDIEDGIQEIQLPFVTEATQAMRIQKIVRNRLAAQKRLTVTLPPDAINLVAGSVASWNISALPKCAGNWRVESINPSAWLGSDGVALRCPVEMRQEPVDLDAWDPATDEFELATETYTPPARVRVPPADLQAISGPGVAVGDVPRVRFSFEPVTGSVVGYAWQWRPLGGDYAEGGSIAQDVRDGDGRVFGYLVPVVPGDTYDIRVRTVYLGPVSDWAAVTGAAVAPDFDLHPPTDGEATGGPNEIAVSFLTPNNVNFQSIEFWGGDVDDVTQAALIGTAAGAPNNVYMIIDTGLGDEETRYYWGRSRGPFNSVSEFSPSVTAITNPAV